MPGFLKSLAHELSLGIDRHEKRPFLKGAMAACALVAEADGFVTFSERGCLDQILETLEELKIFDPHEGVDLFNGFVDGIRENYRKGHVQALKAITEVGRNRKTAELLMKVCIAIATADDQVPDVELQAIDKVAKAVGLPNGRHIFLVA